MDDKKLSPEELETLRIAARAAYYLHGQVEIANRKLETASRMWEKMEEAKADARRNYKKAKLWLWAAVGWWFFATLMWILR